MNSLRSPQFQCIAAAARGDITPPVGIYHRMWGAALHDQATGVHQPLTATLLWLESRDAAASTPRVLISLDHCILESSELVAISDAVATAVLIDPTDVLITLTHTHGSGWMARSRSEFPGGNLIEPYLHDVRKTLVRLALEAKATRGPCSAVVGFGRSALARHRDFFDAERNHAVCGLNPAGFSDDTILLTRISKPSGDPLITVVNYACHPTTLAWENTLISPDWVGSMREVVEQETQGLCMFLQGASGDLGPREGFTGDLHVAEKNGREVGFAVLSALQSLPEPGTHYVYQGPVLSGTWIGTWKHMPLPETSATALADFSWHRLEVELPYRHDLPTIEDTLRNREHWQAEEEKARDQGNTELLRHCRANSEQMTRQLTRLQALKPGRSWSLNVTVGILGESVWIFVPGELYQVFQTELRKRFAPVPLFITTLTGDWQPGYIPPASSFGYGIYQEVIAATSPGSLELLIEELSRTLRKLLSQTTGIR